MMKDVEELHTVNVNNSVQLSMLCRVTGWEEAGVEARDRGQ